MEESCHLSNVKGECDVCGRTADRLHMPEHLHGWYCSACCPVCRQQKRPVAA